jgi:hypothetical protein
LWKIERSWDISQEGLKSTVLKGFESMSKVMESAIINIGERMVEERRRRDSGDREIEERLCRLEERIADKGIEKRGEERSREERIQELERTMEEGKVSNGRREELLHMLENRVKKEEEGVRKVCAEVATLTGRVEALMEEKEEKERQDRVYESERMEQERADRERLGAVEAGLKALEVTVNEKEGDERKGRLCDQEKEGSEELSEDGRRIVVDREERKGKDTCRENHEGRGRTGEGKEGQDDAGGRKEDRERRKGEERVDQANGEKGV